MDTHAVGGGRTRRGGRAPVAIAVALALLLLGAGIGYIIISQSRGGGGEPRGAEVEPRGPRATPEAGIADVGPGGAKPVAAPPQEETPGADASPQVASVAPTEPAVGGLRIVGSVTRADSGAPLPGARVRWIPRKWNECRGLIHDARLFRSGVEGSETLAELLPESIEAVTGEDGAYEIELPEATTERGVVAAWSAGYQVAAQDVAAAAPAVRPADEAPAADGGDREIRLDLSLGHGGSISGRVTEKGTGDPAAGVRVVAGTIEADQPNLFSVVSEGAPSATASADGSYTIQGLPPGEYRVVGRGLEMGYAPMPSRSGLKVVLEAGAAVDGADLEVERGGTISVLVVERDGEPVGGAECRVFPVEAFNAAMRGEVEPLMLYEHLRASTDSEGIAQLTGLSLGEKFRVTASRKGFAPSASDPVELTEDAPEGEVALELAHGSAISGHVRYSDGNPAPDVAVLVPPDTGALLAGDAQAFLALEKRARSDATGAFTIRDLAAGKYRLVTGRVQPLAMFAPTPDETVVEVDGTSDVSGVVLIHAMASEAEAIAGTVTDSFGQAVEGASVRASAPQDILQAGVEAVTTGSDGRFRVRPRGEGPYNVTAEKDGYSSAALNAVPAGREDVMLVLERHGVVRGRVLAPDGKPPAPGGKVRARRAGGGSELEALLERVRRGGAAPSTVAVQPDGSFEVEAPAGEVVVEVGVPGYAPGSSDPIRVEPAGAYTGLEIRLSAGATMVGRVVLADGAGVRGATVTVRRVQGDGGDPFSELMPELFGQARDRSTTGEDGRYEVSHLAAGDYLVAASHSEYAPSDPASLTVSAEGRWNVPILVLRSGGSISGRVLEGDTPKGGMMVQVMGSGPMQQSMTGGDGRFQITGLKAGEYLLNFVDIAAMQSGRMAMKNRVVKVADAEHLELEIVLGGGRRVYGTVKGMPPQPMRMVSLRRPGGPAPEELDPLDPSASIEAGKYQAGMGFISTDGAYEVVDIEPGEYILEVPKMPDDPTDLQAYKQMDRTPHFRKKIKVRDEDLELDIEIKAAD